MNQSQDLTSTEHRRKKQRCQSLLNQQHRMMRAREPQKAWAGGGHSQPWLVLSGFPTQSKARALFSLIFFWLNINEVLVTWCMRLRSWARCAKMNTYLKPLESTKGDGV